MRLDYIDNVDCLDGMKAIPDGSVDLILTDPPYGTTMNKWDSVTPLDKLWAEYLRIIKDNGAILLFAQMPFTAHLVESQIKLFRYEWVWEKENATGFLNANKMPLKKTESVLVFYKKLPTYNPQKTPGRPYKCKRGSGSASWRYDETQGGYVTENRGDRMPTNIIKFNRDRPSLHPTQKPVALLEYLIRTYTNEGEIVLDSHAGSGSTAMAYRRTRRRYICFELDEKYHSIAQARIAETKGEARDDCPI